MPHLPQPDKEDKDLKKYLGLIVSEMLSEV